ncbi:MAG: hypothetical protein ACMXYL_00620 [Candidatus Woesearchaeota archaeon]
MPAKKKTMAKKSAVKKTPVKTKKTASAKSSVKKSPAKGTAASRPTAKRSGVRKVKKVNKSRAVKAPVNKQETKDSIPLHTPKKHRVSDDELGLRLLAALSYCLFLILIPLFAKRENVFVNWHIRQGMIMLIVTALIIVAIPFISVLPVIGPLIVYGLLFLWMALFIWAIVSTLLGHQWKFPLLGNMVSKTKL